MQYWFVWVLVGVTQRARDEPSFGKWAARREREKSFRGYKVEESVCRGLRLELNFYHGRGAGQNCLDSQTFIRPTRSFFSLVYFPLLHLQILLSFALYLSIFVILCCLHQAVLCSSISQIIPFVQIPRIASISLTMFVLILGSLK